MTRDMKSPKSYRPRPAILAAVSCVFATLGQCRAAELHVGAATVSITPDRPIALSGQMHTRISKGVRSPVTATALALESKDGAKVLDQVILVSCDLVAIDQTVLDRVRARLKGALPDFEPRKLVLSATHTHTAPVVEEGKYLIPKDGVMQPAEYSEFLCDRIAERVFEGLGGEKARPRRLGPRPCRRRAEPASKVYADGRAVMYGGTDLADFRGIEGPEDHGVEVFLLLGRWGQADRLGGQRGLPVSGG